MHHRSFARPTLAATAAFALLAAAPACRAEELLTGMLITQDAAAEAAKLCPDGAGYPKEWNWLGAGHASPASATSGTPHIEQWRAGRHIATYRRFADGPGCTVKGDGTDYLYPAAPAASGCGPFTREHTTKLWAEGDVFRVFPAVYTGPYNQPWFGAEYNDATDYNNNIFHTPDHVVVQGIVVNNTRPVIELQGDASNNTLGQAPVYFNAGTAITIDSINIAAGAGAKVGRSGIYVDGTSGLTLSNMRITGFERNFANGLFSTGNAAGTLTLDHLELDHNGGPNGPAHNAYINASTVDPNFTVALSNSWSHDAFYGHLFKTRAQNGIFTANLFQGGLPQGKRKQAENYLLDVPNGGQVAVRNNVFIKNRSGPNSNAMSFTFLMEGATDSRAQSVDLENNTFVTFARAYDGTHLNYPLSLLYPNVRPDSTAWPASIPTRVLKNAFVGYCTPGTGGPQDYRGDIDVVEGFAQLTGTYALRQKVMASDAALARIYPDYMPEIGTFAHSPALVPGSVRVRATIGAED